MFRVRRDPPGAVPHTFPFKGTPSSFGVARPSALFFNYELDRSFIVPSSGSFEDRR